MPVRPIYPGVYVEEMPTHVRTITGVSTSVTAFVGRALRGPADRPSRVLGIVEFDRTYGGLWLESTLGYAVHQFFLNGGTEALIVRVHNGATAARLPLDRVTLDAASEGAWGDALAARVDHGTKDPTDAKLFNLFLKDNGTGTTETFRDVSIDPGSPRYFAHVLEQQSRLARYDGAAPAERPAANAPAPPNDDPFTASGNAYLVDVEGSDGSSIGDAHVASPALDRAGCGLYALRKVDLFNLLCLPPPTRDSDYGKATWDAAIELAACRRAFVIVDAPAAWTVPTDVDRAHVDDVAARSDGAALYFPRVLAPDPLANDRLESFAPCGIVAGIYARTDAQHGVWKAPAGTAATLQGVSGLSLGGRPATLTDGENGALSSIAVNCLRSDPATGSVVWGARTLAGADDHGSQWKYVPVRRLALHIEDSVLRGTRWAVPEPNDAALWKEIRLSVDAFLYALFRQGAFQGSTPGRAYFVKCDGQTTTPADVDEGIVNIVVGFAPLRPAEFVVIRIQQIAPKVGETCMSKSVIEAARPDPYRNFKFHLKWKGRCVAGFSKCGALERTVQVSDQRGCADPSGARKSPGTAKFEPITLEHGITHDVEFEGWVNSASRIQAGPDSEPAREDLILEVYDEAGRLALVFEIFRARPSEFQAMPDLDANTNAVAIVHLELENEGWARADDAAG